MPGRHTIRFYQALCKGQACAICQYACTRGIWPLREEQPEDCVGCRRCMLFCPEMAIDVVEAEGARGGLEGVA